MQEGSQKLKGYNLHVGNAGKPSDGFVSLGLEAGDWESVTHDPLIIPWPVESSSCNMVLLSHYLEKIPPELTIDLFDECWRVLKPSYQLLVACWYANAERAFDDPLYRRPGFTINTFKHFDPAFEEYQKYSPKPWKLIKADYGLNAPINIVMEKRALSTKDKLSKFFVE